MEWHLQLKLLVQVKEETMQPPQRRRGWALMPCLSCKLFRPFQRSAATTASS